MSNYPPEMSPADPYLYIEDEPERDDEEPSDWDGPDCPNCDDNGCDFCRGPQ